MYKIIPAAYIFTHDYLKPIQHGIQSLHVVSELFVQNKEGEKQESLYDWAENHKTVRILNAGGGESFDLALRGAGQTATRYKLPFAIFREPDFHNSITAFGFIVTPEVVFKVDTDRQHGASSYWDETFHVWSTTEDNEPIVAFLKQFPSAK